ncbi:type VII toxin-antitoxin system MntA family adenylyltransferase antitoxin [Adonisia turfae]|nr:nucleotidyltransferase domain-containing protein [Adonisia turfae]
MPLVLESASYLKLLILFGSRVSGNIHPESDWDFAILCEEDLRKQHDTSGWGYYALWSLIPEVFELPDNKVDIVDLSACNPWIVHSIAQEGQLLYEKDLGEFDQFKQHALKTDAELKAYRDQVRQKVRSTLSKWKS